MNGHLRATVIVAGAALLSAPVAASADTGSIQPGRESGLPAHADITALRVSNTRGPIVGTISIAKVDRSRLQRVWLASRQPHNGWTLITSVSFRPSGKVRSTMVSARDPRGNGVVTIGCSVRVSDTSRTLTVSTPRDCIPRLADGRPIKTRAALERRSEAPTPAGPTDRTRFTEFLARG